MDASARAAVDIPAKIRRSPAKAAAVVGGVGFLALKGPQRVFGLGKRLVRGKDAELPDSMLPEEIQKTLRKLGKDGDKVRGTLERDFAEYAQQAQKQRNQRRNLLLLAVAQPLAARGAKAFADFLFAPDARSFEQRMAQLRSRVEGHVTIERDGPDASATAESPGPPDEPVSPEG